jgi:hypothetical protein
MMVMMLTFETLKFDKMQCSSEWNLREQPCGHLGEGCRGHRKVAAKLR